MGEEQVIQSQEPASGGVRRDWQKLDEAASIASLLGAAALLLDARMRERKGSKGMEAAHDGTQGAEDSSVPDLPGIMSHMGRHIHLSSRFLMAPWHLEVKCLSFIFSTGHVDNVHIEQHSLKSHRCTGYQDALLMRHLSD